MPRTITPARTSWDVIREKFVGNARPGTMGHQVQLLKAADLLWDLRNFLLDYEQAKTAIDNDQQALLALANRPSMKEYEELLAALIGPE